MMERRILKDFQIGIVEGIVNEVVQGSKEVKDVFSSIAKAIGKKSVKRDGYEKLEYGLVSENINNKFTERKIGTPSFERTLLFVTRLVQHVLLSIARIGLA